MKIGILGSSFDPPHIGHFLITKQTKEILKLDEIWLMPCFLHPFNKNLSSFQNRLEMTKFMEEKNIKVSVFEIKEKKVNYTIETLNSLSDSFPQNEFYWIIGSDQLETFNKWKNWEEIVKKHQLIVFPRNISEDLNKKAKKLLGFKILPKNIILLKEKNLIITNISSTQIRERIKKRESIKYLVPEKVEKYIIENKLYGI